MYQLSGQEIRILRQRLGWSLAEMARQMGCSTNLIQDWESGALKPEPEAMNQLQFLADHVDNNSVMIAQKPVVEVEMESRRLYQLTHRDLLK